MKKSYKEVLDKKTIWILCVCIPLAFLFLGFYLYLGTIASNQKAVVEYPSGKLSHSVFDYQNLQYQSMNGYGKRHVFSGLPFSMDTADGKKAIVGNGTVYDYGGFYFYLSKASLNKDTTECIKEELTDILLMSANKEETTIELLYEESGYINGCSATFFLYRIVARTPKEDAQAYLCLYRLHVNDAIYKSDSDLLTGCMAYDAFSTDSLKDLRDLAWGSVCTLRFDEELLEEK